MRIISANTNGIRSAAKKGFFDWLKKMDADVICIQETKAQEHQLSDPQFCPEDYFCQYHDAQKKGYSGVAIYSKVKPKKISKGIGWHDIDIEGRFIEFQFEKLSVISLYMHSGSASQERLDIKFDFMERFMGYLQALRRKRREFIICGDWNIAHKKIDIKNWKGNQKNSGFLPEERAWMDTLFDEIGFGDGVAKHDNIATFGFGPKQTVIAAFEHATKVFSIHINAKPRDDYGRAGCVGIAVGHFVHEQEIADQQRFFHRT